MDTPEIDKSEQTGDAERELWMEFYHAWDQCERSRGCYSCAHLHDARCPRNSNEHKTCVCGRDRIEAAYDALYAFLGSGSPRVAAPSDSPSPKQESELSIERLSKDTERKAVDYIRFQAESWSNTGDTQSLRGAMRTFVRVIDAARGVPLTKELQETDSASRATPRPQGQSREETK